MYINLLFDAIRNKCIGAILTFESFLRNFLRLAIRIRALNIRSRKYEFLLTLLQCFYYRVYYSILLTLLSSRVLKHTLYNIVLLDILQHNLNQYCFSDNIFFLAQYTVNHYEFQALTNAFFSVDSFFFLSGLLVVYLGLRQLKRREGRMNVPMMYLHRYLRFTFYLSHYSNLSELFCILKQSLFFLLHRSFMMERMFCGETALQTVITLSWDLTQLIVHQK